MDWKKVIEEQAESGVSVKEFCARRGLSVDNFYNARSNHRRKESARFARVETGRRITLELEGGIVLKVSPADLKDVLLALR